MLCFPVWVRSTSPLLASWLSSLVPSTGWAGTSTQTTGTTRRSTSGVRAARVLSLTHYRVPPWEARMDVAFAHLIRILAVGRLAEAKPEVCLFLADRYWRLADHHALK